MTEEQETYTAEEVQQYGESIARQFIEQKQNTHGFLTKVIENDDTTKTGNVSAEELGNPQVTIRGLKELELFSRQVENDDMWADFFHDTAEIQLATSLSKEGFLMNLAVVNRKELADVTNKPKKQNKGWFRKKNSTE